MTKTAEERVQSLEDLEAIRRLRHEWSAKLDIALESDDAEEAAAAVGWFKQHVTDDFRHASNLHEPVGSAAAFVDFLTRLGGTCDLSFHLLSNDLIEQQPGTSDGPIAASGSWYTLAMLTVEKKPLWVACISEEQYVKRDGAWRVASITSDYRFVSGHAAGWAEQRFAEKSLCALVL